jgi:hypothetical protein
MKMDMGRVLSDPHPIRFHPLLPLSLVQESHFVCDSMSDVLLPLFIASDVLLCFLASALH